MTLLGCSTSILGMNGNGVVTGAGGDRFCVDNAVDVTQGNAAAGTDKVTASIDWPLGENIETSN